MGRTCRERLATDSRLSFGPAAAKAGLRTCFEMRFGAANNLYDGPPSPSKPVGETKGDGFGEPSYEFQNTF